MVTQDLSKLYDSTGDLSPFGDLFNFGFPLQAPEGEQEIGAGTGLGLVICKEYINMMGGDINLESEEGKGSTFKFTINLKAQEKMTNYNVSSSFDRVYNLNSEKVEHQNETETSDSKDDDLMIKRSKQKLLLAEAMEMKKIHKINF